MSDLKIVKLIDPIQLVNILGGLVPKGAYNGATSYVVGDSVDYNGSSYVLFASAVAGTLPTDMTKWQVVANKGDQGIQGIQGNDGVAGAAGANGLVTSIVGGTNITVDNTTPSAPIVNVTGLTKSSVGLGNVENAAASTLYVPLAGGTVTGSLLFGTNLTYNLGSTTAYASNLYARTLNLNATASISGSVAGDIRASAANMYHNGLSGTDTNLYIVQPSTAAASLTLQSSNGQFNSVIGQSGTFRTFTFGTFGSANGLYFQTNNASGTGYGTATALKLDFSQNASFANQVMIGSTSINPTHTLTLPNTATGIALYNTSDQTTNYERVRQYWNGNNFNISTEQGGTGVARPLRLSSTLNSFQYLQINPSAGINGLIQSVGTNSTANGAIHGVNGTVNATSGVQYGLNINPTINQTGTAGYTTLLINPTETAVGSGAKFLGDFQVGGVRKASIDNTGAIMVTGFDAALSTKTANYTLIVSDYTILFDATSGNLVATLPTAASSTGRIYNIKKTDSTANTVTIAAAGAELIDGASTKVISTQYNSYTIQSTGTGWVVI